MFERQWSSVDFNSSMNVEIASCLFLGYEKNSLGGLWSNCIRSACLALIGLSLVPMAQSQVCC